MILVFGKTGQVATELQSHKDVIALGRDNADLSIPITCAEAIRRYEPRAVINAAAYTAVDQAESEENLANTINGHAPGAMASACAESKPVNVLVKPSLLEALPRCPRLACRTSRGTPHLARTQSGSRSIPHLGFENLHHLSSIMCNIFLHIHNTSQRPSSIDQ